MNDPALPTPPTPEFLSGHHHQPQSWAVDSQSEAALVDPPSSAMPANVRQQPKLKRGRPTSSVGGLLAALVLALSLVGGAVFLATQELRSPDFLG